MSGDLPGAELRRVAGRYPTGVAVVATLHDGRPCGLTVNSVTSVSLDPPLVLVAVSRSARAYACFEASGRFAVNVLAEHQEALARLFASREQDKFAGVSYTTSPHGQPILDGVCAWLDCEVAERHEGGRTHTIFVARVVAMGEGPGASPLVFHNARYTRLVS